MSKQYSLIPNLNEIMEEYVGSEEEATQELQTVVTQEERLEVRTKTEKPLKEKRNRKRNAKKTETEQKEKDEADEFVSDIAFVIMEQTILQKNFISKRGFNQLISPFIEVLQKIGWSLLCEHKTIGFAVVVREFYANMVGKKEKMCYVRGKWISFDKEEINKTFNLKKQKNGSKFKNL